MPKGADHRRGGVHDGAEVDMQHRPVTALLHQVQQAVPVRGETGVQDRLQEAVHQRTEGEVYHRVHTGVNNMNKLLRFVKGSALKI